LALYEQRQSGTFLNTVYNVYYMNDSVDMNTFKWHREHSRRRKSANSLVTCSALLRRQLAI